MKQVSVSMCMCEFFVLRCLGVMFAGERKLASDGKDNFERANEDKFTIEAPNLGRLRKITIGITTRARLLAGRVIKYTNALFI